MQNKMNKLKQILLLRYSSGITEPYVYDNIEYFLENDKVWCRCVNKGIIKANILEGTEIISNKAFYYCCSLTIVKLPNSITGIKSQAFYGCSSLIQIEIPSLVTQLGGWALCGCRSLIEVRIQSSVEVVRKRAFKGCTNLKYVYCYKGSKADNPSLYPSKVTFKYL